MSVYDQIQINKLKLSGQIVTGPVEVVSLPVLYPARQDMVQPEPQVVQPQDLQPQPQQIQNVLQKLQAASDKVLDDVNSNNLKQTLITNQQKTSFQSYANQLYDMFDQTFHNIPKINTIGSLILQLEAISETTIKGKKQGTLRQQLVLDECISYLTKRNVYLDENSGVLMRGLIESTFLCNENKLKKIFSDLFDVGVSCMNTAQSSSSSILQGIIPMIK